MVDYRAAARLSHERQVARNREASSGSTRQAFASRQEEAEEKKPVYSLSTTQGRVYQSSNRAWLEEKARTEGGTVREGPTRDVNVPPSTQQPRVSDLFIQDARSQNIHTEGSPGLKTGIYKGLRGHFVAVREQAEPVQNARFVAGSRQDGRSVTYDEETLTWIGREQAPGIRQSPRSGRAVAYYGTQAMKGEPVAGGYVSAETQRLFSKNPAVRAYEYSSQWARGKTAQLQTSPQSDRPITGFRFVDEKIHKLAAQEVVILGAHQEGSMLEKQWGNLRRAPKNVAIVGARFVSSDIGAETYNAAMRNPVESGAMAATGYFFGGGVLAAERGAFGAVAARTVPAAARYAGYAFVGKAGYDFVRAPTERAAAQSLGENVAMAAFFGAGAMGGGWSARAWRPQSFTGEPRTLSIREASFVRQRSPGTAIQGEGGLPSPYFATRTVNYGSTETIDLVAGKQRNTFVASLSETRSFSTMAEMQRATFARVTVKGEEIERYSVIDFFRKRGQRGQAVEQRTIPEQSFVISRSQLTDGLRNAGVSLENPQGGASSWFYDIGARQPTKKWTKTRWRLGTVEALDIGTGIVPAQGRAVARYDEGFGSYWYDTPRRSAGGYGSRPHTRSGNRMRLDTRGGDTVLEMEGMTDFVGKQKQFTIQESELGGKRKTRQKADVLDTILEPPRERTTGRTKTKQGMGALLFWNAAPRMQRQHSFAGQEQITLGGLDFGQISIRKPRFEFGLGSPQEQDLKKTQSFDTAQTFKDPWGDVTMPSVPSFEPPKPPEEPTNIFGGFPAMLPVTGSKGGNWLSGGRGFEYAPSFTALELGRKKGKKRRKSGTFTGLELRPI